MRRVVVCAAALLLAPAAFGAAPSTHVYRIARVVDGDTVYLTTGAKVRLVQIDTPEVYFGIECWGHQASAETKRLLPPGTLVRLTAEPATDSVDRYGRLLRYVVRVRDGLNVNVFLVKHGDRGAVLLCGPRWALRQSAEARGASRPLSPPRFVGRLPGYAGRLQPRYRHRAGDLTRRKPRCFY